MSHTHTPVSASVIKSASRFAPKAVPRKQQPSTAFPLKPASTPTVDDEEENGSEDEDESESQTGFLNETDESTEPDSISHFDIPGDALGRNAEGIPTIHSSISSGAINPPSNQQAPSAAPPSPTPRPTRSLRSTGPTLESAVVPTAAPVAEGALHSAPSSSRKRRPRTSVNESTPLHRHRRRRRNSTPPTAEQVVISPATMTMSEMCVDKRVGRKSSRYAELQEAERQRRRLRELKREQRDVNTQTASLPPAADVPATQHEEDDILRPVTSGTARVMTDANGNIVLDQSSLQVDIHAVHPSALTESLVHTTETVFSSKTNSATYPSTRTHASNTIRWLPADNERFYDALRMFGTDFNAIAAFLGDGKTRRHVKNKFDREERANSDKLTWALRNRKEIDVQGLQEILGEKLGNRDQVRQELKALEEEAMVIKALPPLSQMQHQNGDSSKRRSTIFDD
jgi:transcription factor TFIIIB component B''